MANPQTPSAPSAADLAGINVEPDNVPVRLLSMLAAALTVVIVGMVMLAIVLFEAERGAQFEAKGYGDIEQIPVTPAQ